MEKFINNNDVKNILEFRCPRYHELPKIPLYKDQVISYIEDVLQPLHVDSKEKLLTPTMLNNYVKQKIVSPPTNRKYDEKHIAYLLVVCLLKQVYSLTEICELIRIQIETAPIEDAYDLFCIELEKALDYIFNNKELMEPRSASKTTIQTELVRTSAISLAHKLFIQKYLDHLHKN